MKLSMDMLNTVTGLTWKRTSTLCDTQPLDLRTPDRHADENPEFEEASGRVPYRVHINKAVLEKVGYSPGCCKCAAMRRGDKAKTKSGHHTDECRGRVEKEMLNHESLRKQEVKVTAKQNERFAKSIEQPGAKKRQNAEEQPRHITDLKYVAVVPVDQPRHEAAQVLGSAEVQQ